MHHVCHVNALAMKSSGEAAEKIWQPAVCLARLHRMTLLSLLEPIFLEVLQCDGSVAVAVCFCKQSLGLVQGYM